MMLSNIKLTHHRSMGIIYFAFQSKANLDVVARKAAFAAYCCSRTVGKNVILAQGSCVGYILRSSNSTSCSVLLSAGLLWTHNTMSYFLTSSEGLQPLLAFCAPPPQKPR